MNECIADKVHLESKLWRDTSITVQLGPLPTDAEPATKGPNEQGFDLIYILPQLRTENIEPCNEVIGIQS